MEITVKHLLAKNPNCTEWYEAVGVKDGEPAWLRPFDRYSLELVKPVEHGEVHSDVGAYDEAFLSHLPVQFKLKESIQFGA